MSIAILTACLGLGALVAYGLNRLAAKTARQMLVPLDRHGFPRTSIRIALERIGCTIDSESDAEVSGVIPLDGMHWGQRVSVRPMDGQLLVRSSFTTTQIFGGAKNQENIERFVAEWAKRQSCAGDAGARDTAHVEVVKVNARKIMVVGSVLVLVGCATIAVALLIPSRQSAASSGRYRLIALGAPIALVGATNLWVGVKRLKTSRRE